MDVFILVVAAAAAAVILYQLYSVLGRRIGRGESEAVEMAAESGTRIGAARPPEVVEVEGVSQIKARDPAFDPTKFIGNARTAFETIVRAFTAGDRTALRPLVDEYVYDVFDQAIREREAADRTQSMEFLQPVRADLESAQVEGGSARAKVRFLAEFRTRTKDAAGEAVDDRRTAEVWTFERPFQSRDPKWLLVRVDAAEA